MARQEKPTITDADAEKLVDSILQRRLEVDCLYKHAPDAETAAAREAELTRQIEKSVRQRHNVVIA